MPVGQVDVRVRGEGRAPRDVEVARANDCPWDEETCAYAARGGHLEDPDVGARERLPVGRGSVRAGAAWGGHLEVLKWGARERLPMERADVRVAAAQYGHLEVLRWARENDCPWNSFTCCERCAVRPPRGVAVGARERLPVERVYVHDGGVWRPPRCCSGRAHDCPWSEATCWWAAEHDRLEILKWALANGAPFDGDTGRKLREWSLI